MNKNDIKDMIKDYVNKNYPQKVQNYYDELKKIRVAKLKKYSDVTLLNNGLLWQDDKSMKDLKYSALSSIRYCKSLHLATKNDWRLPTYDELLKLVNYFRFDPAKIDEIQHIRSNRYWTISPDASDVSANWYIDFKYGQTGTALRGLKYNVRCVRDMEAEGELF
ncbi:MAG: DUF1566 domain-containing protein [Campylobacterota bacterium]|nr:DUF1566 domain-containing protein [Campylobacterota bacterium]